MVFESRASSPLVLRLTLIVSALAAGAAAACSSENAPPASAAVSFEASPASSAELGVALWTATSTGQGSTTVRGLAGDGTLHAQLDSSTFADDAGDRHVTLHYAHGADVVTVDIQTQGTDGSASLALDGTADAGANGLPLGLQLLAADVAAGVPVTPSTASAQLVGDPFALPSTLAPEDGNLVQDGGALVQSSCPLVKQCGPLGQSLDCASSAYSLTDCSVKGLVAPLEKGVQLVFSLFGKVKSVDKIVQCPTSIGNFFDTCLALNPNGSESAFGNSACDPTMSCTTAGCTTSTPSCVDSPKNGEVCAPNGTYCQPADGPLQPGNADLCCSGRCGMATEYGSVCY